MEQFAGQGYFMHDSWLGLHEGNACDTPSKGSRDLTAASNIQ